MERGHLGVEEAGGTDGFCVFGRYKAVALYQHAGIREEYAGYFAVIDGTRDHAHIDTFVSRVGIKLLKHGFRTAVSVAQDVELINVAERSGGHKALAAEGVCRGYHDSAVTFPAVALHKAVTESVQLSGKECAVGVFAPDILQLSEGGDAG